MHRLNAYKDAQPYITRTKIPLGGYVLKILSVKYVDNKSGDHIEFVFDVAEGEYKNFFRADYNSAPQEYKKWRGTYWLWVPREDESEKDEWTMRRFKTTMIAFEDSNPGYHWNWDESTLNGKLIGGIFNDKEYNVNGNQGFSPQCYCFESIEKIRSGNFRIPAPTMLPEHRSSSKSSSGFGYASSGPQDDSFINIPDGIEEEVPFD